MAGLEAEAAAIEGRYQQSVGLTHQGLCLQHPAEAVIGGQGLAQRRGNRCGRGIGFRDRHRENNGLQIGVETIEIKAQRERDRVALCHGALHRKALLPAGAGAVDALLAEGAAAAPGPVGHRGRQGKAHARIEGGGHQLGFAFHRLEAETNKSPCT